MAERAHSSRRVARLALGSLGGAALAGVLVTAACGSSDPSGSTGTAPTVSAPIGSPSAVALIDTGRPSAEVGMSGPQGLLFDSSGRLVLPDAGPPPPTALRADGPVAADSMGHDDLSGVTVEAAFRPRHLPAAPKAPEVSQEGIAKAAKLTALTMTIDMTMLGRMKVLFTSRALPFPFRSEIRARFDRYGNFVLWPNATKVRVIAPGAMRTALGEDRVDVTPLAAGTKGPSGAGKRLGEKTRMWTLEGPLGKLRVEVANVPEAGLGGPLLCRLLVETGGFDPATPECKPDELPLFAAFDWSAGDGIDFEVTSLAKRTDIAAGEALAPPPGVEVAVSGLPEAPEGIFLTREEAAAFRTKAIDTKPDNRPGTPGEGLVVENTKDVLLYYLVDGVPVAAVPPQSSRYVLGFPKGRYTGQWRTFLGDVVDPPETFETPVKISNGKRPDVDAGAP